MSDLAAAVQRCTARIAEIEEHTARYPSWVGGTTHQHAMDLKLILSVLSDAERSEVTETVGKGQIPGGHPPSSLTEETSGLSEGGEG